MSAPTNSVQSTVQYSTAHTAGHTPGPWQALNGGPYVTTRVDPEGEYVIAITSNTHSNVQFAAKVASLEDKANATLIARAPDLLAEVTALRATLADAVELVESLRAERDALRAALTSIDKLTRNGPCMSLQAEHEFARSPDALTYKIELCVLVLLIREQARAALGEVAP